MEDDPIKPLTAQEAVEIARIMDGLEDGTLELEPIFIDPKWAADMPAAEARVIHWIPNKKLTEDFND